MLIITNVQRSEWHLVYPTASTGRETLRRLILRPGEPRRTAISQLTGVYDALQRGVDIRTALERAYDVKAVTKEFFERYRMVFESVEAGITGFGDAERKRLFTQRLFNRLMFVAFIEKKGWLSFGGDTATSTLSGGTISETRMRTATFTTNVSIRCSSQASTTRSK